MKILPGLFFVFGFVLVGFGQKYSGVYYRKDKDGSGDITIKEIKKGKNTSLNFYISVGGNSSAPCVGEQKGKAKWINKNIAEYNGDFEQGSGCRLTFSFSGNSLIIRETNCNEMHGASCNFEGKYFLKKKGK